MRFARSVAILAVAVAGCSTPRLVPAPVPPVAAPAPRPTPTPAPAPVYSSWMDVPATPGDWSYRRSGDRTTASFGAAGAAAVFDIVCLDGQNIGLQRHAAPSPASAMTIRTETSTRTLAALHEAGSDSTVSAKIGTRDPLLDAMAFSKGRFAIEVPGAAPLYLPSWPEVTRVIEDCR